MKHLTMWIITGTCIFIGVTAQGQTIPEEIDINLQKSNPPLTSQWRDKKEVKGFKHLAHIERLTERGTEMTVCLTCHKEAQSQADILAENRQKKQREVIIAAGGIKKYMHDQCLSCHKGMKKQRKTTGPTSCKGCHT